MRTIIHLACLLVALAGSTNAIGPAKKAAVESTIVNALEGESPLLANKAAIDEMLWWWCKERPTSDACALFKYRKMVTGPDGKKLDPLPEGLTKPAKPNAEELSEMHASFCSGLDQPEGPERDKLTSTRKQFRFCKVNGRNQANQLKAAKLGKGLGKGRALEAVMTAPLWRAGLSTRGGSERGEAEKAAARAAWEASSRKSPNRTA
eukprot:CAMPEP_0172650594 /NCGR_PEP_ID=MMETSP1068-20121228/242376_1 /TAXON_ID=35684 /ORGANISM="Pseudopedinella elastica, Strain CCMP716" /LENGTH=205 /DNA_ID=CAMNT_0013464963 /DNA_START=22 /DNA_END=640 /DNA_ORIENTATION=-